MPTTYTISNVTPHSDVEIPDGWQVIESGNFESEDKFLIGGRHNAWLFQFPHFTLVFDRMIGTPINHEHLVIRKL